jgi:DNA helicase IV
MPSARRAISSAAEAGLIFAEVRKMLQDGIKPSQIALIGPASHAKGTLSRHKSIEGIAFVDDAIDWRCGAGFLVTTARAFKGLEADIVIVYGLSEFGALFTPVDLYVAWTRARHRLFIICQAGSIRAQVEEALADAERKLKEQSNGVS